MPPHHHWHLQSVAPNATMGSTASEIQVVPQAKRNLSLMPCYGPIDVLHDFRICLRDRKAPPSDPMWTRPHSEISIQPCPSAHLDQRYGRNPQAPKRHARLFQYKAGLQAFRQRDDGMEPNPTAARLAFQPARAVHWRSIQCGGQSGPPPTKVWRAHRRMNDAQSGSPHPRRDQSKQPTASASSATKLTRAINWGLDHPKSVASTLCVAAPSSPKIAIVGGNPCQTFRSQNRSTVDRRLSPNRDAP